MKDTREKIVAAACACFMEKGYERTSVRTILEEAGVSTGSFYHFFSSKDELFEAVVDSFLREYVSTFASICQNHALPAAQRCELLFGELAKRMRDYYGPLGGDRLHWSVAYGLHERTIRSLLPSVEALLTDAVQAGDVRSRMEVDTRTLSLLLIRGVEAILHGSSGFNPAEAGKAADFVSKCREYVGLLLEIRGPEE